MPERAAGAALRLFDPSASSGQAWLRANGLSLRCVAHQVIGLENRGDGSVGSVQNPARQGTGTFFAQVFVGANASYQVRLA